MTRRIVRSATSWLARWGFAVLGALGAVVAICMAARVAVPAEVPSFALQAEAVYRLEVGAAVFVAVYVVAMALSLALHNRAFSEIGMSGVKADDLSGSTTIREQQEEPIALSQIVARMQAKVASDPDRIVADDN